MVDLYELNGLNRSHDCHGTVDSTFKLKSQCLV